MSENKHNFTECCDNPEMIPFKIEHYGYPRSDKSYSTTSKCKNCGAESGLVGPHLKMVDGKIAGFLSIEEIREKYNL